MFVYLIKSALCLALLLAFYHLVLEREKMHIFNRFYLLGSVVFSFLAPLYVIYISVAPVDVENFTPILQEDFATPISTLEVVTPTDYWFYFTVLYLIVASLFLIRFSKNLYSIFKKVSINNKIKIEKATLVLVEDKIAPHTFWNYIFINKDDYFNEKLESELYTHELTHATQKHTLDVLLIELLQILFWINPVIYLLKKAVKLNHEFLADNKVINTYKNITAYQYLLLNKSHKNEYYLASNLNYLLTKKRLQMMTKETKKRVVWLKKLAIIPLLIGAIFLFAERVEAQETIEIIEQPQNIQKNQKTYTTKLPNGEVIEIVEDKHPVLKIDLSNNKYYLNNRIIKLNKLKEEFVKETNGIPSNLSIDAEGKIPMSFIKKVKEKITIEFLDNIILTNKNSYIYDENSNFSNSTPKIIHYNPKVVDSHIEKISPKKSIKGSKKLKDINLKLKDVNALKESINKKDTLKKASKADILEYNTLAKNYNLTGNKRVYLKDVKRLKYLYSKMNVIQKKNSEPFPNFPPPPPSPIVKKGEKSNIPPPPPPQKKEKEENCLAFPETINLKTKEKFIIKCLENHPNNSLQIFNRWGNTVYSKEKYQNNWSGESNNEKLKEGTYFYVFESSKLKKPIKGWVYITSKETKQKTSSTDKASQKKGWEVDVVNLTNNKTGEVINIEKPKSEDYFESLEKLKKVKKNYYLEGKKISKEKYYNLIKSDKDYLIGSSYANKEKSLLNMYISKNKGYIENVIRKNY